MSTTGPLSPSGAWEFSSLGGGEGDPILSVNVPAVSGQYRAELSIYGDRIDSILQFNTNIGAMATVTSATITRTRIRSPGDTLNINYYLGTWAATPPAADAATLDGGTLAGQEVNAIATNTVTLDSSLINKTGTTSLRIPVMLGNQFETFTDVTLTVVYALPASRKLHFARIAE